MYNAEYAREWKKNHPNYQKEWLAKHPDYMKLYGRAWYKKNPETTQKSPKNMKK